MFQEKSVVRWKCIKLWITEFRPRAGRLVHILNKKNTLLALSIFCKVKQYTVCKICIYACVLLVEIVFGVTVSVQFKNFSEIEYICLFNTYKAQCRPGGNLQLTHWLLLNSIHSQQHEISDN